MRALVLSLCAVLGLSHAVFGQDQRMVVVELYTSQGCSSCPPADALLTDLAKEADVIALSLHVDYWDYLGWKDKFALPKFAKRQEYYNMVLPSRYRLVTPQMVVHGRAQVAGGTGQSPVLVREYLEKMRQMNDSAALSIKLDDGVLKLRLSPIEQGLKKGVVQLVHFSPNNVVDIARGENSGRKIDYTNVVTAWEPIAEWDGRSEMMMSHQITQDLPLAVIVQGQNLGPVYAARALTP